MSDIISKKIWKKWYPEELASSQFFKQNTYITHKDQLCKKNSTSLVINNVKKELYSKKESEIYKKNNEESSAEGEKIGYEIGVKRGLLEFEKQQQIAQKKIDTFLSDFEVELSILDNTISTHLVHLVLKIIAKIIGDTPLIKTSFILNKIKEIIRLESIHFDKPKLIIHPDDYDVIKKHFGKIFDMYGWSISCDHRMHLGGCKIESKDRNLDATISTLWRELCRLSLCNENY
ncbi:flagellar assembly protein FliH [Buchnera aphidicola]|uniref:flagellar assembly protein FliH n=1 Tax=Buchnera aphidicola TaxID=9 RepID=UPI0034645503